MIFQSKGDVKMANEKEDNYGFWENSFETRGFAACDHCHRDRLPNQMGDMNPSGRTWQNGKITLCEAHLEEIIRGD